MLYALIGEESLLIGRTLKKLLEKRLPNSARAFNLDQVDAKLVDAARLGNLVKTLPVMAERRVVVLKGVETVPKPELEKWIPCLLSLPDSTDLVLVADKSDKRQKFWAMVFEKAKVRAFKALYANEAPQWVMEEAVNEGISIDREAATWLVSAVGTDLGVLAHSLEKIILYKGADRSPIRLPDVEACVTAFSWQSVFALTDAVAEKQKEHTLLLYQRMSEAGESPILLIGLLARHFRILLKIKEGESLTGVNPYFLKQYTRQAQKFSVHELRNKLIQLYEADKQQKSSPLDKTFLFEHVLLQLMGTSMNLNVEVP